MYLCVHMHTTMLVAIIAHRFFVLCIASADLVSFLFHIYIFFVAFVAIVASYMYMCMYVCLNAKGSICIAHMWVSKLKWLMVVAGGCASAYFPFHVIYGDCREYQFESPL